MMEHGVVVLGSGWGEKMVQVIHEAISRRWQVTAINIAIGR